MDWERDYDEELYTVSIAYHIDVYECGITYHTNVPVHSEYSPIGAHLVQFRGHQFLHTKYNPILTTNTYGRSTSVGWEGWNGILLWIKHG